MLKLIKDFIECESGANAIEYALLAGLIAMALVATLASFGTTITGHFGSLSSAVQNALSGP